MTEEVCSALEWNDMTYVFENYQGSVHTSDGVVADARLDGGHSGVEDFGCHCGWAVL